MKITPFIIATTAATALALPASAQVLGGQPLGGQPLGGQSLGGNVAAGADVLAPRPDTAVQEIGGAVRGAADLTQDTTRQAGDMLRDSLPPAHTGVQAGVETGAQTGAQTEPRSGANAEASAGAMVHTTDGAMLGRVIDVTRDTTGRVEAYVVRTADGAERLLPSASARIEGDAVVASGEDLQAPQQ